MTKVIHIEYDHEFDHYVLSLENGETIFITESNYDRIMIHESTLGNKYNAIVDEHENDDDNIEYLAFELIQTV